MEKPKRICRLCGSTDNPFKKHSGNTRKGICLPCHREYCKKYRDKNRPDKPLLLPTLKHPN